MVNSPKKNRKKKSASLFEDALLDYEDSADFTTSGKYRCRDCGMLFETLEEYTVHHRVVHSEAQTYLAVGMTM